MQRGFKNVIHSQTCKTTDYMFVPFKSWPFVVNGQSILAFLLWNNCLEQSPRFIQGHWATLCKCSSVKQARFHEMNLFLRRKMQEKGKGVAGNAESRLEAGAFLKWEGSFGLNNMFTRPQFGNSCWYKEIHKI